MPSSPSVLTSNTDTQGPNPRSLRLSSMGDGQAPHPGNPERLYLNTLDILNR